MEDSQGACLLKIIASKTGSHHALYFTSRGDVRVGYKGRKCGKRSGSGCKRETREKRKQTGENRSHTGKCVS